MKLAALVAVASGKSATFLDWLHHAENSGKLYFTNFDPFRWPKYHFVITLWFKYGNKTFQSRGQCRKLDPF